MKYIFSSEKQQDCLDIRLPFYAGKLYTRSYQEKFNTYYFVRKVFLNASKGKGAVSKRTGSLYWYQGRRKSQQAYYVFSGITGNCIK